MARALSQIISELNGVYNPQRDVYNQQISQLDPNQTTETQGLEAAKTDAFQSITDQANRRGLFYSGIPIKEEQQYTGATFLPAVANLKAKYVQQRFNLQDALAKITQEQQLKAEDIWQTELNRDESARQADAALRASRAASSGGGAASPSFGFSDPGGGGGGFAPQAQSKRPQMAQRAGGGFNFTDASGRGITAARYSQLTGVPFRSLLQAMANAGDAGARAGLGFIGGDMRADPRKINNQNLANLYYSLTGNRVGVYKAPTPAPAYRPLPRPNPGPILFKR